jgi:hypothetical protein
MDTAPFLDIELKQDSQAKLLYALGKASNNFLYATEFNQVVAKVNLIKLLIRNLGASIEQIVASGEEVALGETANAYATINASAPGYDFGIDGTTFVTHTTDGKKKVYVFLGVPGHYGEANPLESGLELLYDEQAGPLTGMQMYHANVEMNNTAAPTTSASKDDFNNVTVTRTGVGTYRFRSPGLHLGGKVQFRTQSPLFQYGINFDYVGDDDIIFVLMSATTNAPVDLLYPNFQIEVTKYFE